MTPSTPAVLTLLLLAMGAVLSRIAPRKETRAVAVAHAGMALCAALAAAFIDPGMRLEANWGGLLVLGSSVNTMLAPLAAAAFALVLATPATEAGHRTVAQSMGLPALVVASLLANQIASIVVLDIAIATVSISAAEPRARRTQGIVRGLGVVLVLGALSLLPTELWWAPVHQALPAVGLDSASLMLAGVALQAGVGPASIMSRASFSVGVTARALLTSLPFGGMALLLRVAGPIFGHAVDPSQGHVALLVVLLCALLTAALVLVQASAGAAFALLMATTNAVAMVGLMELDAGASLGGELLWASTLLAGAGLGISLVALRARHGRLRLDRFNGYFSSSPRLAALVLFFSIALGGLPGTLDFAALDLILHGDVSHHLDTLIVGAAVMAVTGYAAVRMAFGLLFGPPAHDVRDDDMPLLPRERLALLPLAILLVVAGLVPNVVPAVRQATVHGPVHAPVSESEDGSEPEGAIEGAAASTVVALRTPSVSTIAPSAQTPAVTFHSTRLGM